MPELQPGVATSRFLIEPSTRTKILKIEKAPHFKDLVEGSKFVLSLDYVQWEANLDY